MKLPFLLSGLILLVLASFLMMYNGTSGNYVGLEAFKNGSKKDGFTGCHCDKKDGFANCNHNKDGFTGCHCDKKEGFANCDRKNMAENFTSYFLNEAGGTGSTYQPIGAFDGVKLVPSNGISQYRSTLPNEPLMGPAFEVGPDSLFMFKNNQCKPECCGASFACDGGCVCSTPDQRKMINERGGNRTVEDGF